MNEKTLNALFKPYKIEIKNVQWLKDNYNSLSPRLKKLTDRLLDEDAVIEDLKNRQCSKSENRTCGNYECPYNLLKYDYFDGVKNEC